ncbi:high-affinity branched-chain amino acid transport system permease protein LivH [Antarctobacter heliothermus]|uniref:High-affinity branched-chain amino acid transport system permease protein LivH n=1 Tax=Antarctobacter heliothermus TaxID=74033 RepID=A0A222E466_9RHOB|nr:branched-chain amino acid ABC transporter permease [Antarctobacter heliothermus]ASP20995.1 high-affinity branched-chain amino acid transport system permease protein LivH [Antarctobacter heliothermus]
MGQRTLNIGATTGTPITVWLGPVALTILVVLLYFAPHLVNPGILFVVGMTLIQSVFALSWNLLFGYTGLPSFGHAGFYAIGAYFTGAALRYDFQLHFLVTLVIAGLLGALVALAIGVVALKRLTGIFLAVLTVALTEALGKIIGFSPALGEQDGLGNIPRPIMDFGLFTVDLTHGDDYYRFLVVAVVAIVAGLWWVVHSRLGRAFRAVRDDADRARFVGIDVLRYRVYSFMISGGTAALAGALSAPLTRIVTLDQVNWLASTQPILNSLLGGFTSFWGPIVGSVAFSTINYWTRSFPGLSEMMVGGILVVVILVAPTGIVGMLGKLRDRFTKNGDKA